MLKKKTTYWILGGVGFLLLFFMGRAAWFTITDWLIPQLEGFLAHPKWDYKQYTWGYGTKAPGPSGTITREQALKEAREYLGKDFAYLAPKINPVLSAHQWAALLSFSFNLGRGNAEELIPFINAGDPAGLETQWKKYVYAGGIKLPALVDRRNLEWNIWQGVV